MANTEVTTAHESGDVANGDRIVSLSVSLSSGLLQLDVHGPRRAFGGVWKPATVNWPGIGAVGHEDATAFAALVAAAAAEAKAMDAWLLEFISNHAD